MKNLEIPIYKTKEEVYSELDEILSYIPSNDVYLAHFKTPEFVAEELIHSVVKHESIRDTEKNLSNYSIPIIPELNYKIATCIFSENSKTKGLRRHFHYPKTTLPTITIGKKIYQGIDDVEFKFYRKNSPPDITLKDDFVLRFDSCTLPHEILVNGNDRSIWLFIVIEHCGPIDLELVRDFYNCKEIYNYHE